MLLFFWSTCGCISTCLGWGIGELATDDAANFHRLVNKNSQKYITTLHFTGDGLKRVYIKNKTENKQKEEKPAVQPPGLNSTASGFRDVCLDSCWGIGGTMCCGGCLCCCGCCYGNRILFTNLRKKIWCISIFQIKAMSDEHAIRRSKARLPWPKGL